MERIIQADIIPEEDKIEQGLRPNHLSEYIGQEKAKKNLRVFIEAAKKRGEPLDHVLLYRNRDGGESQDHIRACHRQTG